MPVYSSQMGGGPAAGGLYRKLRENRAKLQAIPEGKGAIGTINRNLVEEPIERPVAPGAKKVVGVKPSEATGFSRGILPQESAAAGQVAGPSAMGMISPVAASTSRIAPRASSNRGGDNTPARGTGMKPAQIPQVSIKPKTIMTAAGQGGRASGKAQSSNMLGSAVQEPLSRFTGGGPVAGLEDVALYGSASQVRTAQGAAKNEATLRSQLPSEQKIRAATTKASPSVAKQSIQKFASNPVQELPKAVKGVTERVKETIQNAVKGQGSYNKPVVQKVSAYQKAVKQLEKAKSVLRSITKGIFG